MAKHSPVSHREYLESELVRALDWLKGKGTVAKRYAACSILEQLATNAPTIFFVKINEFFDLIWTAIWDQKPAIRHAAGKALSACLAVLTLRIPVLKFSNSWVAFFNFLSFDSIFFCKRKSKNASLVL